MEINIVENNVVENNVVENNVVENKCDFDKDSLIFSCPNCAMMIIVKKKPNELLYFSTRYFYKTR